MNLNLDGKVALVSGASSGMGRAIAKEFAAEGARVVMVARREAPLREVHGEIEAAGGKAVYVTADMTTKAGVQSAATRAREAFGEPEIGICNVRPMNRFSFELASEDDFRTCNEHVIMSVVHLAKELSPAMKARRWGRFLTLGSVSMKEPHRFYNLALSNTFRAGLLGLNRSLSNGYAPFGITVNCIAPGHIATGANEQTHKAGQEAGAEQVEPEPRIPLGRAGTAEEISGLAVFLCSDRASYITGQTISIDGGYTRGLF